MAKLPRPGSLRRQIIDLLPATNAEIGDAMEMHNGEVARTMAALRIDGYVVNANPGRGQVARYIRAEAA